MIFARFRPVRGDGRTGEPTPPEHKPVIENLREDLREDPAAAGARVDLGEDKQINPAPDLSVGFRPSETHGGLRKPRERIRFEK